MSRYADDPMTFDVYNVRYKIHMICLASCSSACHACLFTTLDTSSCPPGSINQDLMDTAHTGGHRINNQPQSLIHHAPETQLRRDQVTLVAICFPHHLQEVASQGTDSHLVLRHRSLQPMIVRYCAGESGSPKDARYRGAICTQGGAS